MALAQERDTLMITEKIRTLRKSAGMTQKELAAHLGTTASAISRLERADYKGHTLNILRRVARALGCRLTLTFVPLAAQKEPDSVLVSDLNG